MGASGVVVLLIAATMRSEAAWAAGHEAAWPLMRGVSVVSLLVLVGSALALGLVDAASRLQGLVPLVAVGVLVGWTALLVAATVTGGSGGRSAR